MSAPLLSMTGSVSVTGHTADADFTLDLTSVNHRYLEIALQMPEQLRHLEGQVREHIGHALKRGSISCLITLTPGTQAFGELNEDYLHALLGALERIRAICPSASLDALAVLNQPGVLKTSAASLAALDAAVLSSLDNALKGLAQSREREGANLKTALEGRLVRICALLDNLEPHLDNLTDLEFERLKSRIRALVPQPDPYRLEQEAAFAAQKSDFREEYDRLRAHTAEFSRLLSVGGVCGRRLEFLLQECHRESNTLASKAGSLGVTNLAIELKVLVDELREQVLNLE